MTFYNGEKFPKWNDNTFIGALAGSHIARLELAENEITHQEILLQGYGRIRDIINGPDGFLYFITDELDGKVMKLKPVEN